MFDANSDEMPRRLSQWAQGFADKAEQFHAMRSQVEQIQVSESSGDGAVRVTVDSRGALTELAFTDRIREVSGAELDDGETRLNLSVALRVQSLLGL